MNVKEMVQKARFRLYEDEPWWGAMAMDMEIVYSQEIPHAMGTDGVQIIVNPKLINECAFSVDNLIFIIAHEVGHGFLNHMTRLGLRDREAFNIAGDIAIHIILMQYDYFVRKAPKGILYTRDFGEYAEEIYEKLPKKEGEGEGEGGEGEGEEGDKLPEGKRYDEHIYRKMSEEERKKVEKECEERFIRATEYVKKLPENKRGSIPANIVTIVDNILTPQVPWRRILVRFLDDVTYYNESRWVPPKKKLIPHGIIYPSLKNGKGGDIVVAIDTSGSISDKDLQDFLTEVSGILRLREKLTVRIMMADAEVHYDEIVETPLSISQIQKKFKELTGRGGTNFNPVFEKVAQGKKPNCLVYLTDGDGYYPDKKPGYPVLWVLIVDYKIPWGIKVNLKGGE